MNHSKISSFISFFEEVFSDIDHQCSWDTSGAQILLDDKVVNTVGIALDPSMDTVKQAVERGCELLITHHPLFFTPLKKISSNHNGGKVAIYAIKNNLSILSYHTNLDVAPYGLNRFLIDKFGANYQGLLSYDGYVEYFKLVIFTPSTHSDEVLESVFAAGGGLMGDYQDCSFSSPGVGSFTPVGNANPFIGKKYTRTNVDEMRQEVLVPKKVLSKVISALAKSHPYETPAFDVIPVKSFEHYGLGCIGQMKKDYEITDFILLLKESLQTEVIKLNFEPNFTFSKFAVVSGSGASMWKNCLNQGIKILVTGDMKHHDAIDARENGVCIIDVGHYEAERVYMEFLAELLMEKFNVDVELIEEKASIIYK